MNKHRHSYGSWVLHKPADKRSMDDKEFIVGLRLPPFWYQSCECGYENWVRMDKKPNNSFKFNEMWKARGFV